MGGFYRSPHIEMGTKAKGMGVGGERTVGLGVGNFACSLKFKGQPEADLLSQTELWRQTASTWG